FNPASVPMAAIRPSRTRSASAGSAPPPGSTRQSRKRTSPPAPLDIRLLVLGRRLSTQMNGAEDTGPHRGRQTAILHEFPTGHGLRTGCLPAILPRPVGETARNPATARRATGERVVSGRTAQPAMIYEYIESSEALEAAA